MDRGQLCRCMSPEKLNKQNVVKQSFLLQQGMGKWVGPGGADPITMQCEFMSGSRFFTIYATFLLHKTCYVYSRNMIGPIFRLLMNARKMLKIALKHLVSHQFFFILMIRPGFSLYLDH